MVTEEKRLARATLKGHYILKFTKNHEIIEKCKKFNKKFYDSRNKEWVIIATSKEENKQIRNFLLKYNFKLYETYKLIRYRETPITKRNIELSFATKAPSDYHIPVPDGQKYLEFQKAAIYYADKVAKGRVLIADEMGLGKTIESLGYINIKGEGKILIVTQASVKEKWKIECKKWLLHQRNIQVIYPRNANFNADIIIINYELLKKFRSELMRIDFKYCILDEVHFIQNYSAQRTRIITRIIAPVQHRIFISGTPIKTKPINSWTILSLLRPEIFGDYEAYAFTYCGAKRTPFGLVASGASNLDELYKKLRSTVMIRRLKQDVLKELPLKRRTAIPLTVSYTDNEETVKKIKRYAEEARKTKSEIKKQYIAKNMMILINKLKKEAVMAKLPLCIEFIRNMTLEQKIVVFAHHKDVIERLEKEFKDISVTVSGKTKDRTEKIQKFQTDPNIRVFIGSITAVGVGVDLTAASNIVFLEFLWSPSWHSQAEDRCHRIGQKDSVNCYYIGIKNSIEWKVIQALNYRQMLINKVLDGKYEINKIEKDTFVLDEQFLLSLQKT